jgi:hypothetical protein
MQPREDRGSDGIGTWANEALRAIAGARNTGLVLYSLAIGVALLGVIGAISAGFAYSDDSFANQSWSFLLAEMMSRLVSAAIPVSILLGFAAALRLQASRFETELLAADEDERAAPS